MFLSKMSPLGSPLGCYKIGQILCNIFNGETTKVIFYPGIYYIRAQGAGGKGGDYGYPFTNGNGAPSGAGFEGYIRFNKKIVSNITTGVGGTASAPDGTATELSNIMTIGGGSAGPQTGYNTVCPAGTPGKITIKNDPFFYVVKPIIYSDGAAGCHHDGGKSVLTWDGAGSGSGAATKPGAGGGGTSSIGGKGGDGGVGECLVKFISLY